MSGLRSLLEQMSRDRVLRRRLPPELGGHTLLVSPDAALRFWRRDLRHADPFLLGMAEELARPGDTVWDVGANVGLFTFAAAFLAGGQGHVVAVEADDWLTSLIRRSASTLPPGQARVDVLTAAVADQAGLADFHIAGRGRAGNHLGSVEGSSQAGGTRAVAKVLTVTLDMLLSWLPPPRVVKIDVEGAEARCLRGAETLLTRIRPVVLCEVTEENTAAVGEIFRGHGYDMLDAAAAAEDRRPLAEPVWNTLAVPR